VEVVASLSQGRTAAAQCGLFTHKSVPVIFEPPCTFRETCCCHRKGQLCLCGQHNPSQCCYTLTVPRGVRSQETVFLWILLLLKECICICKHICRFTFLPTYTFVYLYLFFLLLQYYWRKKLINAQFHFMKL